MAIILVWQALFKHPKQTKCTLLKLFHILGLCISKTIRVFVRKAVISMLSRKINRFTFSLSQVIKGENRLQAYCEFTHTLPLKKLVKYIYVTLSYVNKNGNFHSYNSFSLKYLKVIFDKKKNMENESLVSTNYGTNTKCGKVKLTKIQKFL